VTQRGRSLSDLLADATRHGAREIRDAECDRPATCTASAADVSLGGVRGINLRIGPGLFGRRPRYSRITLEGVAFDSIAVRSAIFNGLVVRGAWLDGPFEGFESCVFSGCTIDRLSVHHVLFQGCTFSNCQLDLRPRDGITFIDCKFESVVLKGEGEFALVRSSFRNVDGSALRLDGIIESQGDADLALPATPNCFFVPRWAIDGPLAPVLAQVANPRIQAVTAPVSRSGSVINRDYVISVDQGGTEGEELLSALWPYHIENLSLAEIRAH
jgi:uncharacterized protein YjbI with pentapeptide repeats